MGSKLERSREEVGIFVEVVRGEDGDSLEGGVSGRKETRENEIGKATLERISEVHDLAVYGYDLERKAGTELGGSTT